MKVFLKLITSITILYWATGLNVSYAEVVHVKYRSTPVNLSSGDFYCPSIKSSSLADKICYDKNNAYLLVDLNGTYYHYCRLPSNVFSSWISAPSLGTFYGQNIKGNYDCRLGGIPNYDRNPNAKHLN